MTVNDRALVSFLRVMQFRQEMVARCTGAVDCIVSLVPDASASQQSQSGGNADQSAAAPATAPSSPTQSAITGYTGADGAKKESDDDRKKIAFQDFMSEQRTVSQKFWDGPGHPSDVMPFEQVHTLMENILDAQEPAKFLEFKKQWQSYEKAFHQIAKGAKQSADDTMRHMKVRLAESTREKKRKADQDAKAELQKVREDAKAAADLIKKRKQSHEDKVDPLYTVNISAEVAAEVCKMDVKDLSQTTWRLSWPWKIEASDIAKRRRIIEGLKDQFDLLGLPCEWLPDPRCSCGKREFERRCFDARELLRGALFVYGQVLKDLEARARARTVQCEGDFDTTTLCNCRCGGCDKVTPMGLE